MYDSLKEASNYLWMIFLIFFSMRPGSQLSNAFPYQWEEDELISFSQLWLIGLCQAHRSAQDVRQTRYKSRESRILCEERLGHMDCSRGVRWGTCNSSVAGVVSSSLAWPNRRRSILAMKIAAVLSNQSQHSSWRVVSFILRNPWLMSLASSTFESERLKPLPSTYQRIVQSMHGHLHPPPSVFDEMINKQSTHATGGAPSIQLSMPSNGLTNKLQGCNTMK